MDKYYNRFMRSHIKLKLFKKKYNSWLWFSGAILALVLVVTLVVIPNSNQSEIKSKSTDFTTEIEPPENSRVNPQSLTDDHDTSDSHDAPGDGSSDENDAFDSQNASKNHAAKNATNDTNPANPTSGSNPEADSRSDSKPNSAPFKTPTSSSTTHTCYHEEAGRCWDDLEDEFYSAGLYDHENGYYGASLDYGADCDTLCRDILEDAYDEGWYDYH